MTKPKKCKCGGYASHKVLITGSNFRHYVQCKKCGASTGYHDCEKSAAVEWKKIREEK